ncbi:MAG: DUF5655 domain-containing protein [Methanoregula sp.]|nr:DUF5655 domain-containing protein [Methanoregula sp.]
MRAPGTWTIEGLFEGRPESFLLFQVVRCFIESLGPVTVGATKTQVSFGAGRKFAWVWLPQIWIQKQPKNSITLSFNLDRRVRHNRIKQAVEPYPGRWMHHVVIGQESDFDDDVRGWLREAYGFGQTGKSRHRQP